MNIVDVPNLSWLVDQNEAFIGAVYCHIYAKENQPDRVIRFQLDVINDINEKLVGSFRSLRKGLVEDKLDYQPQLRDYFHRILNSDYLPLLRFSRYELLQISLYGFDIYIQPLEALLELINRLTALSSSLLQIATSGRYVYSCPWKALQEGWQSFQDYLTTFRHSLFCGFLKDYIHIGSKSLARKEKENNLYWLLKSFSGKVGQTQLNQIEISQIQSNSIETNQSQPKCYKTNPIQQICFEASFNLLEELADLNNQLYFFHPSYDYFAFYGLALPLHEGLEPLFQKIIPVAQQCQVAKVLTPLLFGIMRNYSIFLQFVDEMESETLLPYLDGLRVALLLNFKFRILEYQEVLFLLAKVIFKRALLQRTTFAHLLSISDEPSPQGTFSQSPSEDWSEAKDFFLSALRLGYPVGELHTWRLANAPQIQPYIISAALDASCLTDSPALDLLTPDQDSYFKALILQLTHQTLSYEQLTTMPCQFDQCPGLLTSSSANQSLSSSTIYPISSPLCSDLYNLTLNLPPQSPVHTLLKLSNIMLLTNPLKCLSNSYFLTYLFHYYVEFYKTASSSLIRKQLDYHFQQILQAIINTSKDNSMLFAPYLSQKIEASILAYYCLSRKEVLLPLLFLICTRRINPKTIVPDLLSLLEDVSSQTSIQCIAIIFHSYLRVDLGAVRKVFTLNKILEIPEIALWLPNRTRILVCSLIDICLAGNFRPIQLLIRVCPQIVPQILASPVPNSDQLLGFYLAQKQGIYRDLLIEMLIQAKGQILFTEMQSQTQEQREYVVTETPQDYISKYTISGLFNELLGVIETEIGSLSSSLFSTLQFTLTISKIADSPPSQRAAEKILSFYYQILPSLSSSDAVLALESSAFILENYLLRSSHSQMGNSPLDRWKQLYTAWRRITIMVTDRTHNAYCLGYGIKSQLLREICPIWLNNEPLEPSEPAPLSLGS